MTAIASLVLATRNEHKLREFERLLAPAQIAVEPLAEGVRLPPEEGETFEANALPKARAAAAPPGSGLRYVCALAYVDPSNGAEHVFFGECRGRLAAEVRGVRGFGYDPAFLPDDADDADDGRTMAELSDEEKDRISHRGRAVRALLEWLQAAS
jgi:XTP/dITP diphosphohydrolase